MVLCSDELSPEVLQPMFLTILRSCIAHSGAEDASHLQQKVWAAACACWLPCPLQLPSAVA